MNKWILDADINNKQSPNKNPKLILPTSPRNILAGCQLNIKKLIEQLSKINAIRMIRSTLMITLYCKTHNINIVIDKCMDSAAVIPSRPSRKLYIFKNAVSRTVAMIKSMFEGNIWRNIGTGYRNKKTDNPVQHKWIISLIDT